MGVYSVNLKLLARGFSKPAFKIVVKASSSIEALEIALPKLEEAYKEKFTIDQLSWAFLGSDADLERHKEVIQSYNKLEGIIYKKQCP